MYDDNHTDYTIIDKDGKKEFQQTTNEERLLAMLIYATSLFTTIVGPLIIWLLKKDTSPLIDFHGKQYFNFIISYFVYGIGATILSIILIGIPIALALAVAAILYTIIAAYKAYQGERYLIPLIFRIIP